MNETKYYWSKQITRDVRYCPCQKTASHGLCCETHSNKTKHLFWVCDKCKKIIEPLLTPPVSIKTAYTQLLDTKIPSTDPCAWDCATVADMWGFL